MGLYDRDYYRRELLRKERRHVPKHWQFKLQSTRREPPPLRSLLKPVAFWLLLLGALFLGVTRLLQDAPTSGGGWGSAPDSTPTAAQPAASAPLDRTARPPLVI